MRRGRPRRRSPIRWAAATRGRRVRAKTTETRRQLGRSLSPRRGDHRYSSPCSALEALHPLSRPKDFWGVGLRSVRTSVESPLRVGYAVLSGNSCWSYGCGGWGAHSGIPRPFAASAATTSLIAMPVWSDSARMASPTGRGTLV